MKIKALVLDVDGTLTDGSIYIGNKGEEMKRFNAKDGYGIHNILKKYGIIPMVITGRESEIVKNRCTELEIDHLVQGSIDKVADLKSLLQENGIEPSEAAYMGDDLNDLKCLKLVGLPGCPNDATEEVKKNCSYIAKAEGGKGAVREFIDYIVSNKGE